MTKPTGKPRGRPRKDDGMRTACFRLVQEHEDMIIETAAAAGLSRSDAVRLLIERGYMSLRRAGVLRGPKQQK